MKTSERESQWQISDGDGGETSRRTYACISIHHKGEAPARSACKQHREQHEHAGHGSRYSPSAYSAHPEQTARLQSTAAAAAIRRCSFSLFSLRSRFVHFSAILSTATTADAKAARSRPIASSHVRNAGTCRNSRLSSFAGSQYEPASGASRPSRSRYELRPTGDAAAWPDAGA